jgi:hypothetical protein
MTLSALRYPLLKTGLQHRYNEMVSFRETEMKKEPQLNCWIAPGFDSLKSIKKLDQQINSAGGHIEQSFMYLDPMSAMNWLELSTEPGYVAATQNIPMDKAADAIRHDLKEQNLLEGSRLEIIALGCGASRHETSLTQAIFQHLPELVNIKLGLLDISQPLLSEGYQFASDSFQYSPTVNIYAVQGDMHQLSSYHQLFYNPPQIHIPRLITLLGHTFCNLDNEILFLRDALQGFQSGDLLLIDFTTAFASSDCPEDVLANDPYLNSNNPVKWDSALNRFITGPLVRYRKDLANVKFQPVLDNTTCVVPGSYAIEMKTIIQTVDNKIVEFTQHRTKRYHMNSLIKTVHEKTPWKMRQGWRFGDADQRVLYLFRKE